MKVYDGVGLITTVAVIAAPGQLFAVGVIVKVTVTGELVVLVKEPEILPDPLAAMPIALAVLSLVHAYVVPVTAPDKAIVVIAPEQIVCEAGVATAFGVGLTKTVAVIDAPGQLFAVGVIVKVTVTGALVEFVSVPEMLPDPEAAIPVTATALSLVQAYVVPLTAPDNTIVLIEAAEQMVCVAGVATAFGVGLTRTVAVIAAPGQLFAVGVIVKVTVTGALVVLVSEPDMLPEPEAAMPVTATALSLVHAYVVPDTAPVNTIVLIEDAEQMVCDAGVATAFGVGLTNTVAVIAAPGQLFAVGMIVKVTVTGALVVFVKEPDMLPEPEAAMPVTATALSLVHAYVVPDTAPVNTIVLIEAAEQIVCDAGVATALGVGLTKTVAVIAAPGQLFAVGVIVKVTVTGELVVLVSEPDMLPEPDAAMPVTLAVLLRVQAYVVPLTAPVSTIVLIEVAEQIVCEAGVATAFGVGLTKTLIDDVSLQPFKLVIVTIYTPVPAVVIPVIVGFLTLAVNPFGPDQAKPKLLLPLTPSCKFAP